MPHLPAAPKAWIVAAGWSSQSIEAQAFAYLAMRTLNGLPITFPHTTGVVQAMTGGVIARP